MFKQKNSLSCKNEDCYTEAKAIKQGTAKALSLPFHMYIKP